MSRRNDSYDRLVQQTVRSVLFCGYSHENRASLKAPAMVANLSNTLRDVSKKKTTTGTCKDSLLHILISAGSERTEEPAQDDEDNNGDETRRGSWLVDCPNWPVERLRREKATIKRYLYAQRQKRVSDSQKTPKLYGEVLMLHEAYALLKLFLLERDPDYRQCLQQSIGCTNSFLTSLHVLLTLYTRYFERAHGRQISEKTDVKPIETLYEFFLTHRSALEHQQQTE
ncbi:hypothetical protein PHYPSEUDO_000623 [Phytophthora pseudosyringae]|uniref:Uncharacterized protein n=1 Tax=Phytophthora pseudosyringae TaxID=221518 RepID=A0A8T1VYW1_9STRA|nr:hypothetical protein PHYPSEUDO_000623 [Phytophthora pseudosyringae]